MGHTSWCELHQDMTFEWKWKSCARLAIPSQERQGTSNISTTLFSKRSLMILVAGPAEGRIVASKAVLLSTGQGTCWLRCVFASSDCNSNNRSSLDCLSCLFCTCRIIRLSSLTFFIEIKLMTLVLYPRTVRHHSKRFFTCCSDLWHDYKDPIS